MNFRSHADLASSITRWQERLPRDFTLICGVPRSGLLAANILALQWNLPLTCPENLLAGQILGGGRRLGLRDMASYLQCRQKILVVDDSIKTGESLDHVRQALSPLRELHDVYYASVYATLEGASKADFVAEIVESPRVFEWNLFHHSNVLPYSCVDIDGVLCADPTLAENDDGVRYDEFVRSAMPRFIPTVEIGWLVTSRLEKYREATAEWLCRHGIHYRELIMLSGVGPEERRLPGLKARFKASCYQATNARLFVESERRLAADIAEIAKKPVLATDTMELIEPSDAISRVLNASEQYCSTAKKRFSLAAKRVVKRLWPRNLHGDS